VLCQASAVEKIEVFGGYGPDAGSGLDDGVGGVVVDEGAEVAGIGEVLRAGGVPDDCSTLGIVIGGPGCPSRSAGEGSCGEAAEQGDKEAGKR